MSLWSNCRLYTSMGDNGSNGASCEALLPLMQDGDKTQGYGGSMFFVAALWDGTMPVSYTHLFFSSGLIAVTEPVKSFFLATP